MKTRFVRVVSLIGCMLLLATPTLAQSTDTNSGTITVTASGTASVPAESALIVITLGTDTSIMPIADASVSAVTPVVTMETIDPAPVVDALISQGVPADAIEVVTQPFSGEWGGMVGPLPVSLIVTLDQPDVDFISELLKVTQDAAHAEGWLVNTFGVLYQMNDCRSLNQQARVDAMANAQISAEDQAAAMNTTLGSAVGSRDNTNFGMGYPTTSCGATPETTGIARIYMANSFDPSAPAEVSVTVWIDVTYSLP